jgi:hypothetical protein
MQTGLRAVPALWDGKCQACDEYGRVNDISLCEDCAGRVERDLIRQRDWEYSVSAFGVSPEGRERLRREVVREHGEALEIFVDPSRPKDGTRRAKPRSHRRPGRRPRP